MIIHEPRPEPRPPLNLDCLRKQLAAITEHLREHVWKKEKASCQ